MTFYLYVLKLGDGHYYVGITTNLKKRIKQHVARTRVGSPWVREHGFVGVQAVEDLNTDDRSYAEQFENAKTREYIERYGLDKVRGGQVVSVRNVNHYAKAQARFG